jgi:hypothetical protein
MHTTSYDDDIHFLHNGDFSGDVRIVKEGPDRNFEEFVIPFKALEYLVAMKVTGELISSLEQSEDFDGILDTLLGKGRSRIGKARLAFIRSLASLDHPDNMIRRTITLNDIVEDAKKLT